MTGGVLALVAALMLTGCRGPAPTLEADADLQGRRGPVKAAPDPTRLAIAPVELAYAESGDLDRDASRYPAKVDRERLREQLRTAIGTYSPFGAPHPVGQASGRGADLAASLHEAYASDDEVLIRPVLTRLDVSWRGHNGRWVPNLFVWFMWWVPSFWVPDEDYAIEGELELRFYSVASERLLYAKKVAIDETWPLDDFERGWSWTGIMTAPRTLDVNDWGIVADSLAPLALYRLGKAAAIEAGDGLPKYIRGSEFASRDATVFGLVCGVSRHANGVAGAAGAAADAERIGAVLRDRAHVPAKNLRVLTDERATAAAVEQDFQDVLFHTQPGDAVLVYWSGLGAIAPAKGEMADAAAEPERYLLPYDLDVGAVARTGLALSRLRLLISKVPARHVLVVLDASFGGRRPGSRSLLRGADAEVAMADHALERFSADADRDIVLLCASGPSEDALSVEGVKRGLFSYLFEEGASGAADEDRNGVVSLGELQTYLEREVPAQAGVDGVDQAPRLYRGGKRPPALDPDARAAWLANADFVAKQGGRP